MKSEYFEPSLEPDLDFVAVKFASEILREIPFPSSATSGASGLLSNQVLGSDMPISSDPNFTRHCQDALRCFDDSVCDVVGKALSSTNTMPVIFNNPSEGLTAISDPFLHNVLKLHPNCLQDVRHCNSAVFQHPVQFPSLNETHSMFDGITQELSRSYQRAFWDFKAKSPSRPMAIVSPMIAVEPCRYPSYPRNDQDNLRQEYERQLNYPVQYSHGFSDYPQIQQLGSEIAAANNYNSNTLINSYSPPIHEDVNSIIRKRNEMLMYENPVASEHFSPTSNKTNISHMNEYDDTRVKHVENNFFETSFEDYNEAFDPVVFQEEIFQKDADFAPPQVKRTQDASSGHLGTGKRRNKHNFSDFDDDPAQCVSFKQFSITLDAILEESANSVLSCTHECDQKLKFLISRKCLDCLYTDSAQLRSMNIMYKVDFSKLLKLLQLLSLNIQNGLDALPSYLQANEADDDEGIKRSELVMKDYWIYYADNVSVILNILLSKSMPSQLYVEELIELVTSYTRALLRFIVTLSTKTVYPPEKGRKPTRKCGDSLLQILCNRAVETLLGLSHIVTLQQLSDTIILTISSLSIRSFFSDDLNELHFASLRCLKTVFALYPKLRDQILNDILSSVIRFPVLDKSVSIAQTCASYKITCGTNASVTVEKLTALIIYLVQGHAWLSEDFQDASNKEAVLVKLSSMYDEMLSTSKRVLAALLSKCGARQMEDDFRPVFDAFVQDLLILLNRPECPAAEILVSHLSTALVSFASSRSSDVCKRVFSLEHLGHIAAQLRRDIMKQESYKQRLDSLIQKIMVEESGTDNSSTTTIDEILACQSSFIRFLHHACKSEDISLTCARNFYIMQWIHDLNTDIQSLPKEQRNQIFTKKWQLVQLLKSPETNFNIDGTCSSPSPIDYEDAFLISQHLSTKRPLSNNFDLYMKKISAIFLSSDNAIQVRTKALKCLTLVIETDPSVLIRADVQLCVQESFMDRSVSVREAAADLVGRYVTNDKQLALQYYQMLSDRILDTGVSVRKRVIKVFHEIIVAIPDFPQIPDICVRILKRLHDEIGIKKLVHDTMRNLWFTPSSNANVLQTRAQSVTNVISAFGKCSVEHFELLLKELISDDKVTAQKELNKAVSQLIDCLVDRLLKNEATTEGSSNEDQMNWVANFQGIYVLGKVFPRHMIKHAQTLFTYLNFECHADVQLHVIYSVAKTLAYAVPLMSDPSQKFIYALENTLIKLILMKGSLVINGCFSCLSSVINGKSKNYKLARDFMQSFFETAQSSKDEYQVSSHLDEQRRPSLYRALYVLGLFGKHFDLDSPSMKKEKVCTKQDIFNILVYFCTPDDEMLCIRALEGLGFFLSRHTSMLTSKVIRELYHSKLKDSKNTAIQCQVLKNLQDLFKEEEERQSKARVFQIDNLEKDILGIHNDVQLGQSSTIAQIYIRQILEAYTTSILCIRRCVVNVVAEIISLGIIHPIQCYPYLIAMSSDSDSKIRMRCQSLLLRFDKGYPSISHAKALEGLKMSFKLHCSLFSNKLVPKGFSADTEPPASVNAFIYTIIRSNKSYRRSFLLQLLKLFQDDLVTDTNTVALLMFIADNLAYFPYQILDEVLFIIQEIDLIASVSGPNLIQTFLELLDSHDDISTNTMENVSFDDLLNRLPNDVSSTEKFLISSQGCLLLLSLRRFLKQFYCIPESKISEYDRSKIFERQVCTPRTTKRFTSSITEKVIQSLKFSATTSDADGRSIVIENFFELRKMIEDVDVDFLESETVDNCCNNSNLIPVSGTSFTVDLTNIQSAKRKPMKMTKRTRKVIKRRKPKFSFNTDSDELNVVEDDDEDYIP